jgi:hypothetical protein
VCHRDATRRKTLMGDSDFRIRARCSYSFT